jgi:D-2-hydroxyacid dehydrogenase (NADP+)
MTKSIIVRHEIAELTDNYLLKLTPMFPEIQFHGAYSLEDAMSLAPKAHVFIGIGPFVPPAMIGAMKKLEWVQTLTTGVDNFLNMAELPDHVPVTNIKNVQGPQVSETALMLMMSLARRLPDMFEAQKAARWERHMQSALFGKTLCILGLGNISETLALYSKTLGMKVLGVSDSRIKASNVDFIYKRNALKVAAAESDFLVVLVPLSEKTHHIVNADVLSAMKPTAFVLNLARGGCVDEAALIQALQTGVIAGAGLDVFEHEPLPPADPIWSAPNVVLTPHIAGFADIVAKQCLPTVIKNLKIYTKAGASGLNSAIPNRPR